MAVGDDTITGEPDVDGNHGLARTREFWGTTGLGTSDIGKCNTFTAPRRPGALGRPSASAGRVG